jgi:hypothetical protein
LALLECDEVAVGASTPTAAVFRAPAVRIGLRWAIENSAKQDAGKNNCLTHLIALA